MKHKFKIKSKKKEIILSITKAVLGVIPYGGSALCEIVSQLIPKQRLD